MQLSLRRYLTKEHGNRRGEISSLLRESIKLGDM